MPEEVFFMKKKTAVLVISYFSAAVLLLGLFAALQEQAVADAGRAGRYGGESAFEELCAAVGDMSLALEKGALAASPGLQAALCADAYASAAAALTALGQLPFASQELERTAAFLSKAGDYTRCLTRVSAGGGGWSEEERKAMASLGEAAAWLRSALEEQRGALASGLAEADSTREALLAAEEAFPEGELPPYDGRYSRSCLDRECAMLRGKAATSEREAALIAAAFLDMRSQSAEVAYVNAKTPCWRVTLGEYTVAVSAQGGQVLQAVCARPLGEAVLTEEQAREKTEAFLREHGYRSLREIGHSLESATLVTVWCYEQRGVVCYPDEITVALALDTGELSGFDATEYVTCHCPRELGEPSSSLEDALSALPPGLTAAEDYLAVIATDGGGERYCRALRCTDDAGRQWLLFSSAATGTQERISELREDETSRRIL